MSVKIDTPFATVEDTAKALGVPRRRMLRLIRLLDETRSAKFAARDGKRRAGGAAVSPRKRRTRAKTTKNAR